MSFGLMMITALFFIVGAAATLAALQRWVEAGRIAKMPVSEAARLRVGEVVKVHGKVQPGDGGTLIDPAGEQPCVLSQLSLEWRVGWVREREDHPVEGEPFLLDDGSGTLVEVEPRGALLRARPRVQPAAELERRGDLEARDSAIWARLPDHVRPEQLKRVVSQRVCPGDLITVVGRIARDRDGDPAGHARIEAESDWRPLLVFDRAPGALFGARYRPLLVGLVCLLAAFTTLVVSCMSQATDSPP